ncbi:putative Choline dehydrogenase [Glarea lozoyensis 74030]|uniref:Putative Choline dehydrogenase n=1 Tax=Glarea lozoyensis (strain ATCC 74030 / MF5533) TaxID=1104152 RepID=H0ED22_GLAL7|nr:putative Choline dehydrogenase [Glarea lozoyensis 74030]
MTTEVISSSQVKDFDYVIVGGGTAGCVIASRLSEYLPHKKILMIEAGPSDYNDDRVLKLKEWLSLLGGDLDYDYGTTEQPNAMNIPVIHDFNHQIRETGSLEEGVGFFSVSYNPDDGRRSSASVAYIHPILRGSENRPNLTILTGAWVSKINSSNKKATGVDVTLKSGAKFTLTPKIETILCAGAVDTPRLMLLSGIGPKEQLNSLDIPVVHDLPGVGENLIDHPESIIMWELNTAVPPQTTMDSDAGIFLRREAPDAATSHRDPATNPKGLADGKIADIMMHCYQIPFCLNTARLGYDVPLNAFCMTPNIPRPRSRGRIYLTSSDASVKPALDFRYFTDPEGYDAATLVTGMKAARKIASEAPFSNWLAREVAPGPKVQTDEELSAYARSVAHTVYHPAGTTKMGADTDELAVVDEKLKVRGMSNLRIADAGVFPTMTSINPMLTVLAVGERAAELIAMEAGWKGNAEGRAML